MDMESSWAAQEIKSNLNNMVLSLAILFYKRYSFITSAPFFLTMSNDVVHIPGGEKFQIQNGAYKCNKVVRY